VILLSIGLVIVFAGTIAQVHLGLYKAQNEFFRSFFIYWKPQGSAWKIPIFPGGYFVGSLLLVNLIAAHITRFTLSRKKIGIWLVHIGIILLLLGQLLTDMLSVEGTMHLREGQTKNYSETEREAELAVIDTSDPHTDKVVAIPQDLLMSQKQIQHPELPFTIQVKDFFPNSHVAERPAEAPEPPAATQDMGRLATVRPLPRVTAMDVRDLPGAVVELISPQGSLGTWLLSEFIERAGKLHRFPLQTITFNQRTYQLALRPRRHYKPFSFQLLDFKHDVYRGTDTPKNFSSRILLQRPETGEKREINIYMNNPLRYAGETYYQASFDPDDLGSVLQVVRNPSWLTPYASCILVAAGLLVQFLSHLFGFVRKRKTA
jgi:hypothetical protein